LIGRRIGNIGCAKPALHIGSVFVLWERLGDYHQRLYILSYASLVWWKRVELKNAQKRQQMTRLGITGGMRSTQTSALEVMLMLPRLHFFIKQEARQARLLGNRCSYTPNFGHSEVLTDETLLLRDKFVTLNIFDWKFSVDFPTREDKSAECVDLVAPDGLVFFTDESLCEGRADAGVFSDILHVREAYSLGSHATVFQSKVCAILACSEYCISEGIVNRAVSVL
jgi:hypothetical protein